MFNMFVRRCDAYRTAAGPVSRHRIEQVDDSPLNLEARKLVVRDGGKPLRWRRA